MTMLDHFLPDADTAATIALGAALLLALCILSITTRRFRRDEWDSESDLLSAAQGLGSFACALAAAGIGASAFTALFIVSGVVGFVLVERGARQRRTRVPHDDPTVKTTPRRPKRHHLPIM